MGTGRGGWGWRGGQGSGRAAGNPAAAARKVCSRPLAASATKQAGQAEAPTSPRAPPSTLRTPKGGGVQVFDEADRAPAAAQHHHPASGAEVAGPLGHIAVFGLGRRAEVGAPAAEANAPCLLGSGWRRRSRRGCHNNAAACTSLAAVAIAEGWRGCQAHEPVRTQQRRTVAAWRRHRRHRPTQAARACSRRHGRVSSRAHDLSLGGPCLAHTRC